MPRRNIQATITILVLTCGVLLSASINRGTRDDADVSPQLSALEAVQISITVTHGRLLINGTSTSAAHEAALLQLAAEHFEDYEIQTQFRPGVVVGEHWETTTNRLLYTLAALSSAEAEMDLRSIGIRGVTSDVDTFADGGEYLLPLIPVYIAFI